MEYLQALLVYFTVMTGPPPEYLHVREPDGRLVESWAWMESTIATARVNPALLDTLTRGLGPSIVLPALDKGEIPERKGWLLKSRTTEGGVFLETRGSLVIGQWWRMKHVPYEKGHENDRKIEAHVRSLLTSP